MPNRKVLDERVTGAQCEIPRHARVELVTVKSILPGSPLTSPCVARDATLFQALKVMSELDIGAVMVLDGVQIIGIFSERDYVRSSILAAPSPATVAVGEVMTPCAICAYITDSLQHCLKLMLDNRLRYLPILDGGAPIGLLSLEEALREMVTYLEKVFKENEMDGRIANLQGTYSC